VTEFSKDKEHFETVKEDMARLLEAGASPDLQSLYEAACWANPTTRQALIAQQLEAHKAQTQNKVQEAKRSASVNIKKSPLQPEGKTTSIDDTIRAQINDMGLFR
jgi:hypothetical protein